MQEGLKLRNLLSNLPTFRFNPAPVKTAGGSGADPAPGRILKDHDPPRALKLLTSQDFWMSKTLHLEILNPTPEAP